MKELGTVLDGREVEVRVASDLPRVRIDQQRMTEVIRHLLENAAKYSPPATPVHLTAERAGQNVRVALPE